MIVSCKQLRSVVFRQRLVSKQCSEGATKTPDVLVKRLKTSKANQNSTERSRHLLNNITKIALMLAGFPPTHRSVGVLSRLRFLKNRKQCLAEPPSHKKHFTNELVFVQSEAKINQLFFAVGYPESGPQ